MTVDLKDFFSNITHKQVYNALIENHFADKEAKKITRLTTLNGSLPQGAVTSTALANLVFSSTAIEIQAFCVKKGIIFTAFIDDLTFSSNKDFEFYKNDLLQFIKQNGFRLNHKKIKYRRNSCEVTGLIIKNQMLHLEKEMLNRCWMPQIKAYANTVAKHNMIISNEKLLNFRKAAF